MAFVLEISRQAAKARSREARRKSIFGALRLYLDFINMFQAILYLTGSNRNDR